MKKLLEYLVGFIVAHPEKVKIEEKETEEEILIKLSVHPEDMGRIIGKEGKVIKAIRSLAHILAIKKKKRLNIELLQNQS